MIGFPRRVMNRLTAPGTEQSNITRFFLGARATFSNIEHQSIEVVVDSVVPWVKAFEQEANFKLFGQNRTNLLTKMNLNGLPRGDSTARAELYKSLFMVGAASPNMIPRLENMNTIGPDGDKHVVPVNMLPIELAGQNIVPHPPANDPAGDNATDQPLATRKGSHRNGLFHAGQRARERGLHRQYPWRPNRSMEAPRRGSVRQ